jgi:alpha-glucosidase
VNSPLHAADPSDAPWWRSAVIYQVYPRSFADADGDGVGDLPGITGRLDHLAELGIDAVWLSPFYRSPQADAGYDVADYRGVDPLFGQLRDAQYLIDTAHTKGLRVLVDLVPNHTSDEHAWFQAALSAEPGSPERDRYMFRDGRGPGGAEPPNNWNSVFGGPAWQRVPDGQWYLHLFAPEQPDLNWENPAVRDEFESILRYWLELGVDGFRVDVAHGLIKAPGLPDWDDQPELPAAAGEADRKLAPMWDQDRVHEIYQSWRKILDGYPGDRILVAEAWVSSLSRMSRYIRPDEMHQAFNFEYLRTRWTAADLRDTVTRSLTASDAVGAPTTWVLSNHDVVRHATRLGYPADAQLPHGIGAGDPAPDRVLGLRRARAATLLMLGLPGSAYLYQGEELGLPEDIWLPDAARQDPTWKRSNFQVRGRDGCRVPLPWVADAPAYGFGPAPKSWLPQPGIWAQYALDRQVGVPDSTYSLYREALSHRRELGLGKGSLSFVDGGADVVAFRNGGVLVLANLGPSAVAVPDDVSVFLASGPLGDDGALPPDTTVWAR